MQKRSFPGVLDSLEPLRDFVTEAAAEAGLNSTATYNLCLAVDEIATNVITHGYNEAGLTGDVAIFFEIEGDKLILTLEDSGEAYDPETHRPITEGELNSPLEERPIGGLGLMLARKAVDELHYSSTGGRNHHRFVVLLSGDHGVRSAHGQP
jgi:serine/threonine-protein kinase RsbW